MCHVEKCTGGVPLHTHVSGLGESGKGAKCPRPSYLGLVLLVRGEVGDAADSITLDFDVGGQHLADQWGQATQLDDEDLVLG